MTTVTLEEAGTEAEEKIPGRITKSIPRLHVFGIILASLAFAYAVRVYVNPSNLLGALILGLAGSWVAIVTAFTLQRMLVWFSRNTYFVHNSAGEVKVILVWACVKSMRGDRGKRYSEKWHAYSRYIRGWAFTLYLVIALGWGLFLGLWAPLLMNIGTASLNICYGSC